MTPRIEAKDWETIADPASRQQLFMMFVKGELEGLNASQGMQSASNSETTLIIDDMQAKTAKLSSRIWVLEDKLKAITDIPIAKKEEPKVKQAQPWWLQLITKKYK